MLRYFLASMTMRGLIIGLMGLAGLASSAMIVQAAAASLAPGHSFIETINGKQPIRLQSLKITGEINGGVAETTVQMVFFNPNKLPAEGRAHIPLLAGQQITSHSLTIDGKESSDKSNSMQIVGDGQKNHTPGTRTATQRGSNFDVRIMPIAAGATRALEIKYVEPLAQRNGQWSYRLPLDYGHDTHDFSLDLIVYGASAMPVASGALGKLDFVAGKKAGASAMSYQAHFVKKNFATKGMLELSITPSEQAQVPMQEIRVTGIRAASQPSLSYKRRNEADVEAVVAEDMGKMPDRNRADSLQRLPGVTPVAPVEKARWFAPAHMPSPVVAMRHEAVATPAQVENTERYQHNERHGIVLASETPVSTFSIDVDTGSYSNLRRMLNQGRLPPRDAVRVEEMVNYFPYDYSLPTGNAPFAVSTELVATPWNQNTLLLRIGVQAADPAKATLPPANLVFLVDVSGSMSSMERLPLLQNALKLLVDQMRPQDRVSLVTYAGHTRVALEPTSGDNKAVIKAAIDGLNAGGSTAGAAGIDLAYQMAQQGFLKHGINRILLATDGDFNVGVTDFETLKGRVAERRKSGIALSTLGFGTDNYNDKLMEQLADVGDGAYSYIDSLSEAQKVLVNEFTSTLATVASDVKIQLEFNPDIVREYRQIGFENRALKREDFNNDKVDAGEIGAGHRVTALYEITLAGKPGQLDPLRYGRKQVEKPGKGDELGFLRLRYKHVQGQASQLMQFPIKREAIQETASAELGFAAAVAAFGQRLSDDGKYLGKFDFPQIKALAEASKGKDRFGYRGEFLNLVRLAESFSTAEREP